MCDRAVVPKLNKEMCRSIVVLTAGQHSKEVLLEETQMGLIVCCDQGVGD